jgi:hypothetical protein
MTPPWIKAVFWLSAVYDAALGAAFLLAGDALFARFEVPPPNHPGYIQFPALLLLIFALMYARIALAPSSRRELMIYGIGLKLAYTGVTFYHYFAGSIPSMWMPFAYADLVFLVLFIIAWRLTGKAASNQT